MILICSICKDTLSISTYGPVGQVRVKGKCTRCKEWDAKKIRIKKKDKRKERTNENNLRVV